LSPKRLEFYFDYGSPYSYLADSQLSALCERTDAEIVYRPMLLGGVFKATGNRSPFEESCEAKRRYGALELPRWVNHYGVPFQTNPHFPINTLGLMRTSVAAMQAGVFQAFHAAIFPAFWVQGLDLGDPAVLLETLDRAGLDAAALAQAASSPEVKQELRTGTEAAVARGIFGAPTFFVADEMFFGADHLPFVEEALR